MAENKILTVRIEVEGLEQLDAAVQKARELKETLESVKLKLKAEKTGEDAEYQNK